MSKTQFEKDLADPDKVFLMNGKPMKRAIYNLIVSKRDLSLWQAGMKPTRSWFVSDVKKYFGLKGHNRAKLVEQINDIMNKI